MSAPLVVLAVLAVASMMLFFPLNTRVGRIRASVISSHIPFLPVFVVPYLALFPYVMFTLIAVFPSPAIAARLYTSLIVSGLVAALIWYFFPVGASERPVFQSRGICTKAVAWVYARDPRCNAFPSSHTYTALLCSYYLAIAFPHYALLIWGMGTLIVSSTLFLKQHHLQDLVAGGVLAMASIGFSGLVLGSLA